MSPEQVRRRLAAIWSADAVGYSRLMSMDDAGTFAELRLRRELLRERVAAGGGRVVDAVGDNLLAEFPSAVDAVRCGIDAQTALAARDAALPEPRRLPFRVGIHLGEILVDGDALAGDAVNVAARLSALAEPGGVWISAVVHAQVQGKLELAFADRGEQRLKNIPDPIRAFSAASTALGPAPSAPSVRVNRLGIAVLPFKNLSGDPEQEYLADGVAEDLLTRLSRWQVPVVARQSSFAYRDRALDVRQIGRELGVRYVIEGSIRRAGNHIRLAVQLIDAETGGHAWAENFDRELGDPFALQDELTHSIELALGARLVRVEQERAMSRDPGSLDAWDAFMRAQWHHNRHTAEDWAEARRLLRDSAAALPRFAPLQAAVAIVECTGVINGWSQDRERSLADGLAAARTALALDPNSRDTQTAIGVVSFQAGDHARARSAFQRGVELEPENPVPLFTLAWFLTAIGAYPEAIARGEEALALRERIQRGSSADGYLVLAQAHLGSGQASEALRCAQMAVEQSESAQSRVIAVAVLGDLRRLAEARRELARIPDVGVREVSRRLEAQVLPELLERILAGLRAAGMPE